MTEEVKPKSTDSGSQQLWLLPFILGAMTLLASGLLMFGNYVTQDKIEAIETANKLASLQRIMPAGTFDNDVLTGAIDIFEPIELGHREAQAMYVGTLKGELSVLAIPVTARDGYSGDIELLVGIKVGGNDDGIITAVEILAHKETPGLGDLIESRKSDWIQQFPNKSLHHPKPKDWKVKKDQGYFDQITAATITPRAVVSAIKKALFYAKNFTQERSRTDE